MKLGCLCRIGQPFSGTQELHELFSTYDTNHSGQLEFNEFLVLFKDRLTDVQKTLQYISLKPAKSNSSEPSLLEVCSTVLIVINHCIVLKELQFLLHICAAID